MRRDILARDMYVCAFCGRSCPPADTVDPRTATATASTAKRVGTIQARPVAGQRTRWHDAGGYVQFQNRNPAWHALRRGAGLATRQGAGQRRALFDYSKRSTGNPLGTDRGISLRRLSGPAR